MARVRRIPTDTTTLARPAALRVGDRERDVVGQRIPVCASWWQQHLDRRGLPGGPLLVQTDDRGQTFLTRQDVWALAPAIDDSDEAFLSLLWHALAWGAGSRLRNEPRRMDSVAADPVRAVELLREAAALSSTSPEQAYAMLHPRGVGAITQLGPAFGTKFLYFAGGGVVGHPALIFDKRAATTLHASGWSSLTTSGGWAPYVYKDYCVLAGRWANELSTSSSPVAADQIERWLYEPT